MALLNEDQQVVNLTEIYYCCSLMELKCVVNAPLARIAYHDKVKKIAINEVSLHDKNHWH